MEPEGSSPYSQQPATCPYPEPDRSSPCPPPPSNLSKIHFNITLPSTPGFSKCSPSLSFPHQNPVCTSPPYVPHVLPISVLLTWSPKWDLVSNTEHKAPCYVVFSTPLLPRPSWAHISSSALYSRKTLSLHFSLNVSDQVSHPNNRQDHSSVYLNLYISGHQTGTQNILNRMIRSILWFVCS
jgi:hypothetical protein